MSVVIIYVNPTTKEYGWGRIFLYITLPTTLSLVPKKLKGSDMSTEASSSSQGSIERVN